MAKAKKTTVNLMNVEAREKAKPRAGGNRYWQPLREYVQVGYRPTKNGTPGAWAAKVYVNGKEEVKALPTYGEFPAKQRFDKAKAAAEAHYAFKASGGRDDRKMVTVTDACRKYAETHPDAEGAFKRRVYEDAIAKVRLDKLKHSDVQGWRERIEAAPTLIGPRKGEPRAPATINREMVQMRAALNAVSKYIVDQEWGPALQAIPDADESRGLYLPKALRQLLLANCNAEIEPFLRGLCLTPIRPGALSYLTVRDFNRHTGELHIRKDKTGPRKIHVGVEAAALLLQQMKGKLPSAPMFMRANGEAWDKDTWKGPVKEAVVAAKLDPDTVAYTLRHSVITDLIKEKVPTLFVAKLAGTSVEQIEKHYGHLLQDEATAALDRLAL
ncbi:MAG TPA: site-specific integrase [Caulobacteraceae bacterium]|nr:site-specific integrase [Caulobacteraceae bacterium]